MSAVSNYLMMVHPPSRGHNLGIPGSAATDARTTSLGYGEGRHGLVRLMVLDDGGSSPMQISMHIQISFPAHICLVVVAAGVGTHV